MSDTTIEQIPGSEPAAVVPASDEQLVAMLVDRVRSEGLHLTGEGGLLQ
jgi:putative transposase